jgi:hypothetical protein
MSKDLLVHSTPAAAAAMQIKHPPMDMIPPATEDLLRAHLLVVPNVAHGIGFA